MPRRPLLLLFGLTLLTALPAAAQTIYRCTAGDRTIFSDRPCPGAEVTRQTPASATQAAASTAPSAAQRYTPPVARGGALPSAAELERRCNDGDAGACDFLACARRNDKAACARAQGAPQGRGPGPRWTAVSTRDVQRPQQDQAAGVRMVREREIVIECDGGRRGLVMARPDLGRYRLPDDSTHASLEGAAAQLCTH